MAIQIISLFQRLSAGKNCQRSIFRYNTAAIEELVKPPVKVYQHLYGKVKDAVISLHQMYSATSFDGKIEEDISDHLIGKRVVYELRVDIHPSGVMVQSYRAAVINRQNYIAYRINKKPTSEDWCYSRKVLNGTKHQTQSILKSIWKSTSHLLDSEFWMLEFVKYSLVSKRAYNTNYFDEVSIAMLCIIRREKIIELLGKYKAGESCSGADFEDKLNNCVGYKVKLLFDRNKPHQLTGFAVLFYGDRKTVLNHPEAEAFAGTSLSIIVKS